MKSKTIMTYMTCEYYVADAESEEGGCGYCRFLDSYPNCVVELGDPAGCPLARESQRQDRLYRQARMVYDYDRDFEAPED